MKKILLFSILLVGFTLKAQCSQFFYTDTHAMGGHAMIGLGTRMQKGYYALDLSLNSRSIVFDKNGLYHSRALLLAYPMRSGFYFGGGMGYLNEPESMKKSSGSIEGCLGYEWRSGVFFQTNATNPLQKTTAAKVWPGMTLGYRF